MKQRPDVVAHDDPIVLHAQALDALDRFAAAMASINRRAAATGQPFDPTAIYDRLEIALDTIFGPLWRPERSNR